MNPEYQKYLQTAQSKSRENKQLVKWLNKKKPADLDAQFLRLHEGAFEEIDCLECGNCCKSISPAVHDRDVERIARAIGLSPSKVVETYMYLDDEGDYVMNVTPCPFLGSDHYCAIYEHRPKACRAYPHTDHNRMFKYLDLALKNAMICPAVALIFEKLKIQYA